MGLCLSKTRVSNGGKTTTTTTTTTTNKQHKEDNNTKSSTTTTTSHNNHKQQQQRNSSQQHSQKARGGSTKRSSGIVPCGKRTDFGYDKDFEEKYSIGNLLGHGQFGYTFVATDKSNGDRVAVKRIDKNKVCLPFLISTPFTFF